MLQIRARRRDGQFSLSIDGHADAGPRGRDIVCAAVSATVNAALLGLAEIARGFPDFVSFELDDEE